MNISPKFPLILVDICSVQAPIYVNKQIVFTDAIDIGYGMGRVRDTKPTYDVSLDRYLLCLLF